MILYITCHEMSFFVTYILVAFLGSITAGGGQCGVFVCRSMRDSFSCGSRIGQNLGRSDFTPGVEFTTCLVLGIRLHPRSHDIHRVETTSRFRGRCGCEVRRQRKRNAEEMELSRWSQRKKQVLQPSIHLPQTKAHMIYLALPSRVPCLETISLVTDGPAR